MSIIVHPNGDIAYGNIVSPIQETETQHQTIQVQDDYIPVIIHYRYKQFIKNNIIIESFILMIFMFYTINWALLLTISAISYYGYKREIFMYKLLWHIQNLFIFTVITTLCIVYNQYKYITISVIKFTQLFTCIFYVIKYKYI